MGVVLAVGRSERLAAVTGGGSKALLRLGGLSLVERAVGSLLAAGLERVLVVVGHDAGPVATVVGRFGRDRVRVVYADRWADGNGASLAGVHDEVLGEALFVLVTADHVVGEGGLDRLLAAAAPAVLIDPAAGAPAWKDADGPVSRWLNRPLSTRLSMLLAPLRPSPDLVSLVAFVFGLAGAVLLAVGQGLAGGLLVHASSVADGVDGEVARLQLRGGPRGALLDGVLDPVGDAAILVGLGLWGPGRAPLRGGAGADRGRDHRGAVVDGVQGPGSRWGYRRHPSGRWGGCWAAGTGGCCWSAWARSWAHRSPPWPRSPRPRRCRSPSGSACSAAHRPPDGTGTAGDGLLSCSRSFCVGSVPHRGSVPVSVRGLPQPPIASARLAISSGDTSSTWLATLQRCPNGSSNWPVRSP